MYKKIIIFCGLSVLLSTGFNLGAAILDRAEVESAGLDVLQDETLLFQSIGLGITLSIAQCEGEAVCVLTVDEDEIAELIKALDNRIDSLTLKQEAATDQQGLDQVLTAYVKVRNDYGAHLETLKSITGALDEDLDLLETLSPEPGFPVESVSDAELSSYIENELSFFGDDKLEDDKVIGDFPVDYSPIPEKPDEMP